MDTILKRRSVRKLLDQPVEEEKKEDGGKKEKKSRDGIFSRVRWKVANIFNEMDNENV